MFSWLLCNLWGLERFVRDGQGKPFELGVNFKGLNGGEGDKLTLDIMKRTCYTPDN